MDADDDLVDRAHSLSDLELAVLLSLVSQEHCVIGTPDYAVDDLVDELCLVTSNIFGLQCAVINCHEQTTLEDFTSSLMVAPNRPATATTAVGSGNPHHPPPARPPQQRAPGMFSATTSASAASASSSSASASPPPVMANVILAKNLNRASKAVQIQALELLRSRRIFTHTTVHAAPKMFLFLPVVAAERGFLWEGSLKENAKRGNSKSSKKPSPPKYPPHMVGHLNDVFSMAHWHDPDDGFPNLDEEEDRIHKKNEESDSDSIVRSSTAPDTATADQGHPTFSDEDIHRLTTAAHAVRVDVEVLRYEMNIVAFLRLHRAVSALGGNSSSASPAATKHFEQLAQCLAPLHRLDYVTPSLVALAARKVYLHRIRTIGPSSHGIGGGDPENNKNGELPERSMQWGSERSAVEALLDGVSPEDVIEDVLGTVPPPV